MALRNLRRVAAFELGAPHTTAEERQSLDQLFSLTYEELRRLAYSVKRGDPSVTLSPTALVNEAWVKLANSMPLAATSQLHFKRIAARAMRQVLIEAARRRNSHKRGGEGEAIFVTFDDSLHGYPSGDRDLRSWKLVSSEGCKSAKFQTCWAYRKPRSCVTGGRRKRGLDKRFVGRREDSTGTLG